MVSKEEKARRKALFKEELERREAAGKISEAEKEQLRKSKERVGREKFMEAVTRRTEESLRGGLEPSAKTEKASEEEIKAAEAEKKAAEEKTTEEELKERLAKKQLAELEEEEKRKKKEEEAKKTAWGRTKRATGKGHEYYKHATTDTTFITFVLLIAGSIAHLLKYTGVGWIGWFGSTIDSFLAVWVGVIIFEKSQQKNPVKRILYSIPIPLILFFLSQGALYIIIERLPLLAAIPGLDFTLNPKYWPWWAIYAIWTSKDVKLAEILKVAHAMFIFWLVFWPIMSPAIQPIIEAAEISREKVEKQGASRTAAYAACLKEMTSGKLTNLDLQTCVDRKMHPPTEEEVRAKTIGRIKKALRQAVTASISINPSQIFEVQEEPKIIRGRASATSINKDIEIQLNCVIDEDKATSIISPKNGIFEVKQSEIGDSTQFECKPEETLTRGTYKVTVTGDIPSLEVNSVVVNFFIDEDVLRTEQEKFITSKEPANLKVIEQWSKMKAATTSYSLEKATNFLNKEIYKSYIRATYPDMKVQSESDPSYIKLNLMAERLYPSATESNAVIGLSERPINFEIGIENNLKDGKIISINSGVFEEFPPFLDLADDKGEDCPIERQGDKYMLDKNKLLFNWKSIDYQKEKSYVCRLKYNGQLENPEEIQTAVFSLTVNYNYQIEKKGTFEVLIR